MKMDRFRKLLRLLSGTNETILDVLWIGSGNCLDCLVGLMRLSLMCCVDRFVRVVKMH